MSAIDWDKAGTRLRRTPSTVGNANPDWNYPAQRWKDLADYAADALNPIEIRHLASCPTCGAVRGFVCRDGRGVNLRDECCSPRRRAAGERKVEMDAEQAEVAHG